MYFVSLLLHWADYLSYYTSACSKIFTTIWRQACHLIVFCLELVRFLLIDELIVPPVALLKQLTVFRKQLPLSFPYNFRFDNFKVTKIVLLSLISDVSKQLRVFGIIRSFNSLVYNRLNLLLIIDSLINTILVQLVAFISTVTENILFIPSELSTSLFILEHFWVSNLPQVSRFKYLPWAAIQASVKIIDKSSDFQNRRLSIILN